MVSFNSLVTVQSLTRTSKSVCRESEESALTRLHHADVSIAILLIMSAALPVHRVVAVRSPKARVGDLTG